jgi:hypothetical protein
VAFDGGDAGLGADGRFNTVDEPLRRRKAGWVIDNNQCLKHKWDSVWIRFCRQKNGYFLFLYPFSDKLDNLLTVSARTPIISRCLMALRHKIVIRDRLVLLSLRTFD